MLSLQCNDGVLNALLTALNERKYTNEGRTYPIPTISFFAASNEIPNFNDPEEKILAALYDRLELKVVTENISEKSHRLAILKDKLGGSFGTIHATISLEELRTMQQEVAAIQVPDSIHDLMDDVLCALRTQIPVSDRKFLSYFSIAQAKAWLEGHTEVTSTDLLVRRKTCAQSRRHSANSAASWCGSTRCRPRWQQASALTAKRRLRTDCFPNWSVSARRCMRRLALLIHRWSSWQPCSKRQTS